MKRWYQSLTLKKELLLVIFDDVEQPLNVLLKHMHCFIHQFWDKFSNMFFCFLVFVTSDEE